MKSFLNRKLRLAFGVTMVTLLLMGAVSYRLMLISDESGGWVLHTNAVLIQIKDLLFSMESLEYNSRQFVLTGKESDLESYQASVIKVGLDEQAIRTLTADNPLQQNRLVSLAALGGENIRNAETIIGLRRVQGHAAAVGAVLTGQYQVGIDEFQALAVTMQDEEIRLRTLRLAKTERYANQTKIALILGTLLGLLISGWAAWSALGESTKREAAEDALRDSQDKYRMLLDGVQDYAIFMLDPHGRVASWSASAERIKGYTADEIIGRNFSCFFLPEDIKRGRPEEVLRIAEATGRHEEFGTRVRKDGSEFLASLTFIAMRDESGSLRGFSEICRDLSEHKESEARYRGLLEAAPDGMVVVDQTGKIILLNVHAEKQFRYHRDELVGKHVTDIIPNGFAERLIADGTRTAAEALAQQMGTGIELIGRRKDGSRFPIEIMLSPLESAEGILVTAAIRDITVRKVAEKNLVQMEARYRGLLEAAPDAMVVVNQAGEIVLVNAQAENQFGHRRDELIGQKVTNIIPEGFAERLIADGTRTAAEALAQQIGTGIELVGSRKDGSEFPIEIMLSPLESPEGTLVTVAIRNITARKDLEKRVEERNKAIAQQSRNFNTTIASIVDHAFMFDPQGRFVYANQAFLDLLERTMDEVIGKTCFELPYTRELAQRVQDQIQQVVTTGQKVVDVTHYINPSGIDIYSEYFFSPMLNADGVVEFVAGGAFDITKRKTAEVHLAQMEGRYRGLLEAAPDGMVVVNQAGEIVLLNAQAENQFGYRRDELIGQRVTNIIPVGFAERLIADGTRTAAEALAQQIGMGIELIGLRKDGSEFPIEIMLSPLESPDGILVTAAIRNITVRKDAEKHLAQMEGRYRGLMEAAPDGMVVVDKNGDIVLLNARAEKQFGYRRDELIGQRVTNIIPIGFAERLIADALRTTAEALAQQIGTGIELNGRRSDGTEFPIEIMLSPLESPEGILVTAAIRDISERKQLARQLHQSQKMEAVGQLTGGIAHDFNNLLGVITGNLDLLERLVGDNAPAVKRVQTAQKAAARGADITRRLLVFSSNEELRPSIVLLGDSIQNMIELAGHGLGPNIKITTRIDESVPPIFIDPAGLESALLNLVVNARDAMPRGGSILIASHAQNLDESHPAVLTGDLKPGPYVCIAVTDSGQGMSRQTMERIFEPFFTTKPRDKGTGLGLAMVYGFVKQSGGTVRVYSELDHGTTVSFYLPLPSDFAQPVPEDVPKPFNRELGCTVLVVDDEEDLLEIAIAYLDEMAFTSFQATDGASALEILVLHNEIELLVTDIVMPGGMNGVDLVQRARDLRPDLKIIYSSGFPAEALAERSMPLFDGPLLRKPYQRHEFAAIIHRVMEGDYATAEK